MTAHSIPRIFLICSPACENEVMSTEAPAAKSNGAIVNAPTFDMDEFIVVWNP